MFNYRFLQTAVRASDLGATPRLRSQRLAVAHPKARPGIWMIMDAIAAQLLDVDGQFRWLL